MEDKRIGFERVHAKNYNENIASSYRLVIEITKALGDLIADGMAITEFDAMISFKKDDDAKSINLRVRPDGTEFIVDRHSFASESSYTETEKNMKELLNYLNHYSDSEEVGWLDFGKYKTFKFECLDLLSKIYSPQRLYEIIGSDAGSFASHYFELHEVVEHTDLNDIFTALKLNYKIRRTNSDKYKVDRK